MRLQSALVLLCIILLITPISAQDTSKIGVKQDNRWEYRVEKDTEGDFAISQGSDGKVAEGDTYTFTITSDIDSDGTYSFEYENDNVIAQGEDSLDIFGLDPNAVYTDWDYWETNIESTDAFSGLSGVTVDNGEDIFKATYDDGTVLKIVIEYYKEPGVVKEVQIVSYSTSEELVIVNETGAEAEDAPGFGIAMVFGGLFVAMIFIRQRKKNL